RRVLANDGILADLDERHLALELEILRLTAEDRPDADLHAGRERDVLVQHGAWRQDAAVTDDAPLADDRVRPDGDALPDARIVMDDRGRMNHGRRGGH